MTAPTHTDFNNRAPLSSASRAQIRTDVYSLLRFLVPAILLAALLISMQPFGAQSTVQPAETPPGNDAVNQIGYSLLGIIALAGMVMFAQPRRVTATVDVWWLLTVALLGFSAFNSPDTGSALRSLAFTLIVVMTCIGILTIPRNEDQLRRVFLFGVGSAIALSYIGVFALPGLGVHSADSVEFQHEGLWRGHFSHKNIAGPVMAVLVFFGIYFMRAGNRVTGLLVTALATVFVLQTGSKTTIGFLPLAIAIVMAGSVFGARWIIIALTVLSFTAITALTLGTVVANPLADAATMLVSDPSYTGRTTLWAFGLESISVRPWTGYGFDGFWLKPVVTGSDLPFDAEWDYREIVHGHNNFVDIMLNTGILSGLVIMFVLCVRPLGHFLTAARLRSNRRLADLYMMIIIFTMLNSHLESFWFRRADPIWVLMILGVFGLALTARAPYSKP